MAENPKIIELREKIDKQIDKLISIHLTRADPHSAQQRHMWVLSKIATTLELMVQHTLQIKDEKNDPCYENIDDGIWMFMP